MEDKSEGYSTAEKGTEKLAEAVELEFEREMAKKIERKRIRISIAKAKQDAKDLFEKAALLFEKIENPR